VRWPPAWELVSCKRGSWKGAAVQRGLESGIRGLGIVRNRYQETSSEDTAYWKNLACSVVICRSWKSSIIL
jgi:hypothetical protein